MFIKNKLIEEMETDAKIFFYEALYKIKNDFDIKKIVKDVDILGSITKILEYIEKEIPDLEERKNELFKTNDKNSEDFAFDFALSMADTKEEKIFLLNKIKDQFLEVIQKKIDKINAE